MKQVDFNNKTNNKTLINYESKIKNNQINHILDKSEELFKNYLRIHDQFCVPLFPLLLPYSFIEFKLNICLKFCFSIIKIFILLFNLSQFTFLS